MDLQSDLGTYISRNTNVGAFFVVFLGVKFEKTMVLQIWQSETECFPKELACKNIKEKVSKISICDDNIDKGIFAY